MGQVANYLLSVGADINMKNRFGNSPAFWCVFGDAAHEASLKFLLAKGADLGLTNNDGVVLYDLALSKEKRELAIGHMNLLCKRKREKAIADGVIRHGCQMAVAGF